VQKGINQPTIDTIGNSKPKVIEGEYIVIFNNQFDRQISKSVARKASQLTDRILSSFNIPKDSLLAKYQYAIKGFAAKLSKTTVTALKKDPRIKNVTPNVLLKPLYSRQIGTNVSSYGRDNVSNSLTSSSQIIPWGVSRVNGPFDGSGKKAWIIGTGIDLDNTDLNVDAVDGRSFISGETDQDIIGHGTYVAGLLAAKNNNKGVVGVAAGTEVVPVKVCNNLPPSNPNSGCPEMSVMQGIDYVAANAHSRDIVNISLGFYDPQDKRPQIDNSVIGAASNGIRFVISAGNSKVSAENFSPARVEHSNVWTVSAFKQGDRFAVNFQPNCVVKQGSRKRAGSNYGNPPINYSEPGDHLKSLLISGSGTVKVGMGYDGECSASGTSYAAPILAGLLLAAPHGVAGGGTVSNDPDGNPDPIAVGAIPPPLSVYVRGPQEIQPHTYASWTADPSNGTSPYQYHWLYQYKPANGNWTDWEDFGNRQKEGITWCRCLDAIKLQVRVTDATNATAHGYKKAVFDKHSFPSYQSDSTIVKEVEKWLKENNLPRKQSKSTALQR
jgi:hypothetical protein